MRRYRIRDFLPKSLFGRSLLILLVPILVIQLVVGFIFLDRLFGDVTKSQTREVAQQIRLVLDTSGTGPDISNRLRINEQQFPISAAPNDDQREIIDISGRHVIDQLRLSFPQTHAVDLKSDKDQVFLYLRDGDALRQISFDRNRASAPNPHQLLVAMVLASILMACLAIIFLRNQIKPIRLLARAADSFGKGRNVDFQPRGASEVRMAGHAFRAMKSRIERHLEQRTLILSGVSHDLRTPLTRMKLSLSLLDEGEDIVPLQQDVKEMEGILDEFLAFTRGDAGEEPQSVLLQKLIGGIVEDQMRTGAPLDLVMAKDIDQTTRINCRPLAITRAITNFLGNARKYGSQTRLKVEIQGNFVTFAVEDDGPGIPEVQREEALRPFARLDQSRNQDKGSGTGLGLAIAADIARSHGGHVMLSESPDLGGLRAELSIPV